MMDAKEFQLLMWPRINRSVIVGDEGITIKRRNSERTFSWDSITKVTLGKSKGRSVDTTFLSFWGNSGHLVAICVKANYGKPPMENSDEFLNELRSYIEISSTYNVKYLHTPIEWLIQHALLIGGILMAILTFMLVVSYQK